MPIVASVTKPFVMTVTVAVLYTYMYLLANKCRELYTLLKLCKFTGVESV